MFELYELIKTKEKHEYKDVDGNLVIIPKGAKAMIIEKYDGWYIVEFLEEANVIPVIYNFNEDEIEKI